MDKFKQYIEQHKSEMDVDLPPAAVWENIQDGAKPAIVLKPVSWQIKFAAAAIFALLTGAGIWIVTRKENKDSQAVTKENKKPTQKDSEQKTILVDTSLNRPLPEIAIAKPKQKNMQMGQRNRSYILNAGDLEAIDKTYSRLVSYRMQRLRTTPVYAESPGYFSQFVTQLAQMDDDEEKIKEEIEEFGLNDQLMEGLITIYQNKLSLLKTLQKEIKKMNGIVNKNESKEKLQAYYLNL